MILSFSLHLGIQMQQYTSMVASNVLVRVSLHLLLLEYQVSDTCIIDAACLGDATTFPVSEISVFEALVLRWSNPARAGDAFIPFGERRRRPFLREGSNGFVLRVEVGTLDPLTLSMLLFPSSTSCFLCGLGRGSVRTPWSRLRPGSRIRRRWMRLTLTSGSVSIASVPCPGRVLSVCVYYPCGGHDEQSYGVSDHVYFPYRASCSFNSALSLVGETSQQRQGACRAEEMGRRSQARQLVEQQDESAMPAQRQVKEEVSTDESVAQPQGAAATAAVKPKVEQTERQQRSGTRSTRAGRCRTTVTEDRTALLESFLHLRPSMFHGEYDPGKAESWTHELECILETMECTEEDQVRLAVYQLKGTTHEWWTVQR
ncbi:hypothetical protein Taro_052131 [Colocasia esculenta]|uniref:Uncharacterized protein n=1 Tax=Colocasia esculenta TaxID=4460 RepID=A0A843XIX3_COLES|nr:hypothetical protein [Colocasia esculenta]